MQHTPVAAPAEFPEMYAWRLSAAAQAELIAGAPAVPAVHAGPPALHAEPPAVHAELAVALEPAVTLVANPASAPHDLLLLEQSPRQMLQSAVQHERGQSAPC